MSFERVLERGDRGFISECKGQSVPAVGGCDGEGSRAEGEFCAWDLEAEIEQTKEEMSGISLTPPEKGLSALPLS